MGPGWVANYSNFALTDVWIEMCSLLAVYLLAKNRGLWLTVVICCIGVLIYPGYVFTHWNIVVVFIFYKAFVVPKKGVDKRHLMRMVIIILCVGSVCCLTLLGVR